MSWAANPQFNYLILTKFPLRMAEFTWPRHCWLGTTVDAQARMPNAEKALWKLREQVDVLWGSFEPMLTPLGISAPSPFDWIVIGGASATDDTPAFRPPREWVFALEEQCDAWGIKVFEKPNCFARRTEFPFVDTPPPVDVPRAFKIGYLDRDAVLQGREDVS